MITLQPVFDRERPVERERPYDWRVPLNGASSVEDVELFMRNGTWAERGATAAALVAVVESRDMLFIQGGLVATDTDTGVVVVPGCCAGLESWREWWWIVEDGSQPELGHDPTPVIEPVGDLLRVWQDEDVRDAHVDIPRAALPGLLSDVERDLKAFLGPLRAWAVDAGVGDRADALVAAVDHGLAFSPR